MSHDTEQQLQLALNELMKQHGTRAILAHLIFLLEKHRTDSIDTKLITSLRQAGSEYAAAMGLFWYDPHDYLKA